MTTQLAVFDIDGTIAEKGKVPESVIAGLTHLRSLGFTTTISSGRGYARVREALGEQFEMVISPEARLIIEHGTKITDVSGGVVHAQYLSLDEIEHIIDFSRTNAEMIRLLWFMDPDPTRPVQIWCEDPGNIAVETEKRGAYGEVFHCSFEELKRRMLEQPISSVSAKLEAYVHVENLKLGFTRSKLSVLFQDSMMEYLSNSVNKAVAIQYLEDTEGITLDHLLVAGNAINDVEMLNLGARRRILVGEGDLSDAVLKRLALPNEVVRVASPEKLGEYLQQITD